MRFFIFLIIALITASCFIFGRGETFDAIYGEYPFWATTLTILIIIYVIISRNPKNYARRK